MANREKRKISTSDNKGRESKFPAPQPSQQNDSQDDEKGAVPPFISKLIAMLNDKTIRNLISWSADGSSFTIYDSATLAKEVLPKYYKHSNFTSLVRQLNMYGFRKVLKVEHGGLKAQSDLECEFQHPLLQRDRPELLVNIKRKESEKPKSSAPAPSSVNHVLSDLSVMQTQQAYIADKFREMQEQNERLWQEVLHLRQQHARQQWRVNQIMQFLARYVQEHPNSVVGRGPSSFALPADPRLALESDLPLVEDITGQDSGFDPLLPDSATIELPPEDELDNSHGGSGGVSSGAVGGAVGGGGGAGAAAASSNPGNSRQQTAEVRGSRFQPPTFQDTIGSDLQGLESQFQETQNKLLSSGVVGQDFLEGLLHYPSSPSNDDMEHPITSHTHDPFNN